MSDHSKVDNTVKVDGFDCDAQKVDFVVGFRANTNYDQATIKRHDIDRRRQAQVYSRRHIA